MNYNFYASKVDKLALLDYLFTETDLRLYDLYSAFGEEVCEYGNAKEVVQKFDLDTGGSFATTFQLWSPRFGAMPEFIRIDLNPLKCEGYTFRFRTSGWGLIQLYFGGQQNGVLANSHIGHFNEKGALVKEAAGVSATSRVAQWNWMEITATSRKLKRLIHLKWSANKLESEGVPSNPVL